MFAPQTNLFSTDPGKIADFTGLRSSDVFNQVVVPRASELEKVLQSNVSQILDAPRPRGAFDPSLLNDFVGDSMVSAFSFSDPQNAPRASGERPRSQAQPNVVLDDYDKPLPQLKPPAPEAVKPEKLRPSGDFAKESSARLTNYGYDTDAHADYNSNVLKIGHANNPLIDGVSAALSKSLAKRHGIKPGQWFEVVDGDGKKYQRRYDDTVPSSYKGKTVRETVDLYDRNGSDNFRAKVVGIRPLTSS